MVTVYLLSGKPGTGKTTIIKQIVTNLRTSAGGFYTEEIRTGNIRQGFRIKTLDGQDAILAHVNFPSRFHVSKYSVAIDVLDRVGVTAIHHALEHNDLVVIDEIGKMELFSERFQEAVITAINSDKKVLGTIMINSHPFADKIKMLPRVKVIELHRENHEEVLKEINLWLKA